MVLHQVLGLLEPARHGAAAAVPAALLLRHAQARHRADLLCRKRLVGLHLQARGLHGIDADGGPIRGVHHRQEAILGGLGPVEPFREEHDGLAPRHRAQRVHDGDEGVGGDEAVLVALEMLEGVGGRLGHGEPGGHDLRLGAGRPLGPATGNGHLMRVSWAALAARRAPVLARAWASALDPDWATRVPRASIPAWTRAASLVKSCKITRVSSMEKRPATSWGRRARR